MTTAAMTEKQRAAIEAMEEARRQGLTLKAYAEGHGQKVGELYWTIATLRRRGLIPKAKRSSRSRFLSVRLSTPAAPPAPAVGVVVCRIETRSYSIECTQWPAAGWVSAVISGSLDAAA